MEMVAEQVGLFNDQLPESELNWGNSKPPSAVELEWIRGFGRCPEFDPSRGRISNRVSIEVANLKEATRIVIYYHYLHRGRTMAQLPYWVMIDGKPIGVLLYSLPRISATLFGVKPMNIVELARLWISPDVQGKVVEDSKGRTHAPSIASCAVGKSLRRVQRDWHAKYPQLPDVYACVSWADDVHHEGVIYRACNFQEKGKSGGTLHGNRQRRNGGRDQLHADYKHPKTMFFYPYDKPLSDSQKAKIKINNHPYSQIALF